MRGDRFETFMVRLIALSLLLIPPLVVVVLVLVLLKLLGVF